MLAGRDISVAAIASRDGKRAAQAHVHWECPRATTPTRLCWLIPMSTPCTTRCPTICIAMVGVAGCGRQACPVRKANRARRCTSPHADGRSRSLRVLICEAAMVRVSARAGWLVRDLLGQKAIGELRAFVGTFGYRLGSRDNVATTGHGRRGPARHRVLSVTMSRFSASTTSPSPSRPGPSVTRTGCGPPDQRDPGVSQGHAIFTVGMETFPCNGPSSLAPAATWKLSIPGTRPATPLGDRGQHQFKPGRADTSTSVVRSRGPVHPPGRALCACRKDRWARPRSSRGFDQEHGGLGCAPTIGASGRAEPVECI